MTYAELMRRITMKQALARMAENTDLVNEFRYQERGVLAWALDNGMPYDKFGKCFVMEEHFALVAGDSDCVSGLCGKLREVLIDAASKAMADAKSLRRLVRAEHFVRMAGDLDLADETRVQIRGVLSRAADVSMGDSIFLQCLGLGRSFAHEAGELDWANEFGAAIERVRSGAPNTLMNDFSGMSDAKVRKSLGLSERSNPVVRAPELTDAHLEKMRNALVRMKGADPEKMPEIADMRRVHLKKVRALTLRDLAERYLRNEYGPSPSQRVANCDRVLKELEKFKEAMTGLFVDYHDSAHVRKEDVYDCNGTMFLEASIDKLMRDVEICRVLIRKEGRKKKVEGATSGNKTQRVERPYLKNLIYDLSYVCVEWTDVFPYVGITDDHSIEEKTTGQKDGIPRGPFIEFVQAVMDWIEPERLKPINESVHKYYVVDPKKTRKNRVQSS